MTYEETLAHIFGRGRFGIRPGLERVTEVLARLGNPHRSLRIVQIAGTNGKGSTGAFLGAIMTAAGHRTAFFSSPHLSRFSERFRIDGSEVSPVLLHDAALRVLAAAPAEATFFEIVTAMAFLVFSEAGVDLAIMEAGMGGRWDATNVADPVLSIITPISLDHCAYLGNTLTLIAAEKAGIIKEGAPVVIAPQETAALRQLEHAAGLAGAPVYLWGRDFRMEPSPTGLAYRGGEFVLDGVALALRGRFQQVNAATAITAARLLGQMGFSVSSEALRRGLAAVVWPGRMELFGGQPPLLLDGAHNPAGAAVLRDALADCSYNRLLLVVGVMADKDWQDTIQPLLPLAARVIAVEPAIDRALPAEELASFCKWRGGDASTAGSVNDGIESARSLAAADDLILVTGSLFTVGEARAILTGGGFMPIRG